MHQIFTYLSHHWEWGLSDYPSLCTIELSISCFSVQTLIRISLSIFPAFIDLFTFPFGTEVLIHKTHLKKIRFHLFEGVRESMSKGRGHGRGLSRLPVEQEAQSGALSQDLEIMTWAKVKWLTDWATQAPLEHPLFILNHFS